MTSDTEDGRRVYENELLRKRQTREETPRFNQQQLWQTDRKLHLSYIK